MSTSRLLLIRVQHLKSTSLTALRGAAALAVMHYRMGRLKEAQDMYARAYETQACSSWA